MANRYLLLEAAEKLGVTVISSASIFQGRVAQGLPAELRETLGSLSTDAQTAIQFVRSAPGITTALVGMSRACAAGMVDVLRDGPGTPAALAWIAACTRSGVYTSACPERIDPAFMLRLATSRAKGNWGTAKDPGEGGHPVLAEGEGLRPPDADQGGAGPMAVTATGAVLVRLQHDPPRRGHPRHHPPAGSRRHGCRPGRRPSIAAAPEGCQCPHQRGHGPPHHPGLQRGRAQSSPGARPAT